MIRAAMCTASPRTSPATSSTSPLRAPAALVLDPPPREAIGLLLAPLVRAPPPPPPAPRARALRCGGRVDDVGEQEGAKDPLRALVDAGERAHAGDVVGHPRLIADDPAVVPRRDVEDRVRPDLEGRAVLHAHAEPAPEADADVVVLAEPGPGQGLDVLGPVRPRLDLRAGDDQVVEREDVDPAVRRPADLVGRSEGFGLESGHGTRSRTRSAAEDARPATGRQYDGFSCLGARGRGIRVSALRGLGRPGGAGGIGRSRGRSWPASRPARARALRDARP